MFDNKWIFFHCVKRKYPKNGLYSSEYECEQIDNILNVKLPKLGNEEYLIPLCAHIPKKWLPYYLNKHIQKLIKIEIINYSNK